jgi:hypothetical protein
MKEPMRRPQPSLAEAAQNYARRGWEVFPVEPRGKRPSRLVPHGLLEATNDPRQVRTWWASQPRANIGIRTGHQSGLVVLDIDGPAGVEALRRLVAEHGRFRAPWARTGGGGWHAYLAHPGVEVRNSAGRLGAGLDVRGDGGYVVAPPSVHETGRRYLWREAPPAQLPAMPPWMVERVAERPASRPPVVHRVGDLPRYATVALEREAGAMAATPPGQRNHRLNRAAFSLGQLVGAGLAPENAVVAELLAAARTAGLSEREALRTIHSGLRAGEGQPRQVTPRASGREATR